MEEYAVVASEKESKEPIGKKSKKKVERVDDWEEIRDTYVYSKTKQTLAWVARKHNVPYSRAWWHYEEEDWPAQREAFWDEYRSRKKELMLQEFLKHAPADERADVDDSYA